MFSVPCMPVTCSESSNDAPLGGPQLFLAGLFSLLLETRITGDLRHTSTTNTRYYSHTHAFSLPKVLLQPPGAFVCHSHLRS